MTRVSPTADAAAPSRALLRQERQARVGILRNPNQPPKPPPRRARLMGKWPALRSSRRPGPDSAPPPAVDGAPTPAPAPGEPVRLTDDGAVAGIDIAGLMASVEGIAATPPARAPFAAEFRHDVARASAARARRGKPSILSAEAWIDPDDPAPPPPAPSTPRPARRRRARRLWPLILGTGLALAILVLVAPAP